MSADARADDPARPSAATLVLGVGASRGCPAEELAALARDAIDEAGRTRSEVRAVATIDVKAREPAIVALAEALGVPLRTFAADRLADVPVPSPSAVVAEVVGTPSVAEAAALLAAGTGARLLVEKRRSAAATCAVGVAPPS